MDGKSWIFDTNCGFTPRYRTNRTTPVRNSESTYLNRTETTSLAPRCPVPSCYKDWVFSNLGGNFGFFKIAKNVNSEPISKGWELPETHWTSPLGPLASGMGLGFRHGAKHSLPGGSGSKIRPKTSKFMKSIIYTAHEHFR